MTDTLTETVDAAAQPSRDLASLPKGHLHLHLEAAIRPETLTAMGDEMGIVVPMVNDFSDFTEFSQTYRGLLAVLSRAENLFRLIDEAVKDAAAQGVVYLELGVSPHFYAETFGSTQAALEAMLERAAVAGGHHNVAVGYMVTVDRTESVEVAVEYARLAARYAGQGVVSLGLANDERGYPAELFEEAFAIAKAAGLMSTPHAGELVGPESVRNAITALGADRILHGVRAIEDAELVAELAASGICLDVCPTSNLLLSVVPSLEEHPLIHLLDAGVRCSINADDPILFGPDILAEYELCREVLGLSDQQLAACALSSIECTAAPESVKTKAKADIEAWLS